MKALMTIVAMAVGFGVCMPAQAADFEFPFNAENTLRVGHDLTDVKFADLDGDGDLDILLCTRGEGGLGLGQVRWFRNSKNGKKWSAKSIDDTLMVPVSVVAGDVDGDGDLDVVANGDPHNSPPNGGTQWYENLGKGKAWQNHKIHHNGPSGPVALGDMDGDGDLDVVQSSSNSLGLYLNEGKGKKWSSREKIQKNYHKPLLLIDYDGDKDLDIVTGYEYGKEFLWIENAGGPWNRKIIRKDSISIPTSLQAIDMDKDGDLDMVVGAKRQAQVYENLGKGKWAPEELDNSKNMITSYKVRAGDVDRDGVMDVVGINDARKAFWFKLEDDEWERKEIGKTYDFPKFILVGDLDGDGDADVSLSPKRSYNVHWFENKSRKK